MERIIGNMKRKKRTRKNKDIVRRLSKKEIHDIDRQRIEVKGKTATTYEMVQASIW